MKVVQILICWLVTNLIVGQSESTIDSLLSILKEPAESVDRRVTDYENVIKHYEGQKDSIIIIAYLDSLKQYCDAKGDKKAIMRYWMIAANNAYLNGKNRKSLSQYDLAFNLARELKDKGYESYILSRKARIYERQGQFDSARHISLSAIDAAQMSDEPRRLTRALQALGNTEQTAGNFHAAIEAYLRIDSVFQNSNYENANDLYLILVNMGLIYDGALRDSDKALEYLQRASELHSELSDPSYQYITPVRIANILLKEKEFSLVDSLLTSTIEPLNKYGRHRTVALASMYLGKSKMLQGNLTVAADLLLEAKTTFEKLSDVSGQRIVNRTLAQCYLAQNNLVQAEFHLKESLRFSFSPAQRLAVIKELAAVYARRNRFKPAYDSLLVHTELLDSLYEIEYQADLNDLESKYQATQKEREIVDLKLAQSQQEMKRQRTVLWGGLGVFSLLTLAGFFFYRSQQKTKINKKLQELDELKSKLFSDISHEFRTPLTLIKGPLDLLTSKLAKQDEVAGELAIVQRNASKLNRLVDSIQNLARLDAGQLKLNIRPAIISKHLKIIAASFESMALSKGLQFDTKINLSKDIYYYDPMHLETIMYNLLSNALKFTWKGSITMTAELGEKDLEISVSDTGVGLSQEQQSQVFTRYYRTESDEASIEGIGIGLALSSELAKLHYGSIDVRAALGKGSTFILRLPVHKAFYEKKGFSIGEQFLLSKHTQLASSETHDKTSGHSFHEDESVILLVEDNPDMQQHLKAIFEDEFQILIAKNGKEGTEQALHHIPDLIISDLMMPVMDGQAFLKEVKTDTRTSHIPFIMLTANHLEHERIKGLKQRVDDYMTKPFSLEEIRLKVNNLIVMRELLRQKYQHGQEVTTLQDKPINETEEKFWTLLKTVVQENLNNTNFSAEDFAKAMFMSRMQLHRKLKATTNLSTTIFLRTERLKVARKMLEQPDAIVANIAYDVGFSSPSFFSKCFKEQFGMTPKEMQHKLQR